VTYGVLPSRIGEHFPLRDYLELAAYYTVEPWGELRGDVRTAIQSSLITQLFCKKGVPPERFMPFLHKQRPSEEELRAKFMAWARQHNAVERGRI